MASILEIANQHSDISCFDLLVFAKKYSEKYGFYEVWGSKPSVINTRGLAAAFRKHRRETFISRLTNAMMQLGIIPEFKFENSKEIDTGDDFEFGDGQHRLTIFNLGEFDSEEWEHQEFITFMKSEGWERLKPGNVFIQI